MILNQRQLQREIYAVKESLTDEQLFLSPSYEHKLTEMGHGVTNCTFDGKTHMMNGGNDLAFTDGNDIYINFASEYAKTLDSRAEKHRYFLGLNLHEYGHILFTDFKLAEQVADKLKDNTLYPMPKENDYLKELLEFMADATHNASALQGIHHSLDNSIEDGFVDRATCRAVPGYADCLQFVNEVDLANDLVSYKEMKDQGLPNPLIFSNLVLAYCVYGTKGYSEEEIENDKLLESFEECLVWLRKAMYEARPLERKRLVNTVFCHLFHFIKQEAEKQQQEQEQQKQEQSGSSGSGEQQNSGSSSSSQNQSSSGEQSSQNGQNGQNTEGQSSAGQGSESGSEAGQPTAGPSLSQALNDALNALNNQMQSSEKTEHRNAKAPNQEAINELATAMEGTGEPAETESGNASSNTASQEASESGASAQLEQIAQDIAISQICNEQERNIQNQMQNEVRKFLDGVQDHRGVDSRCTRANQNNTAVSRYEMCHSELDTIVRRFIKDFEKEIKDRQLGDTMTGLYAGKRLDTNHLYRSDKRIYSRKILPEDIPDLAVGILVDCSGSMGGDRIEIARKCAYITYSFCQKLHIPCFVIGHHTSGNTVLLDSVADEKSLDSKDKIRIFGLEAGGSNRDGYALRYCLKKLEHIPANDKLMLVISDGRPAHNGYGMESGQKDCQSAVHDAIKKGIWTIAAGIGRDADSVKEVYKEGRSDRDSATFLDLSDMQRLPKAFVKIIKQRLEKSA